jgi:VWFA-related protein
MSATKTRHVLIACWLAAAAPLAAARPQTPVFRSGVTLVTVDVTVLDRDGNPVPGLKAEDFEIKLNGKAQPVRTLSFVRVAQTAAPLVARDIDPEVTGRHVATNTAAPGESKVFVLMIDDLSYPPEAGRSLFTSARKFVERQPDGVYVGLSTTSGSVIVNPTSDHAAVAAAMKKVVGEFTDPRRMLTPTSPTVGIAESIDIVVHNDTAMMNNMLQRECLPRARFASVSALLTSENPCAMEAQSAARMIASQTRGTTARQVDAVVGALQAMKGAPGLKQMVLLSEGIGVTRESMTAFTPVARAAAEAGVQISVLVEEGNDLDMADTGHVATEEIGRLADTGMSMRRREDRRMFKAAMQTLADVSGGTFETIIGQADRAFDRAAASGSAVYRLGVEPPAGVQESKPLNVSANVRRPGLAVHANRQAVLPGERVEPTVADRTRAAINEGQPLFGVPIRMSVVRRQASSGQVELGIGLEVPGTVKGPLTATFGLVDAAGALKSGAREVAVPAPPSDYRLTFPIPVAPGAYTVRFAVADASGGVGSAETSIDAHLMPMGPFDASDVLTWWNDAAGKAQFLALDRIPAGVTSLGAGLELYPRAGAALPNAIRVKLSLVRADGSTAVEREVTPLAGGNMFRAEAALPLDGVAAGQYILRAAVTTDGKLAGTASAIIRR